MNKMRNWMVGLAAVSLLAVGVVAVAGNGFGGSASRERPQAATGYCDLRDRDADGDGIPNSQDADWSRPLDGSGYGAIRGHGQGLSGDCPADGTGYRGRPVGGMGQGSGNGLHDGSCLGRF